MNGTPKLPQPSWGIKLAGLIQGLTLILLALGLLMTAFGRLDDSLTQEQKDHLLQGFIWLHLIEAQMPEPELVGQTVTANSAHRPDNATAVLNVPNDVDIRSYMAAFVAPPAGGARLIGDVAVTRGEFGTYILRQQGNAPAPNNEGTSGGEFRVTAIVLKKHGGLNLTQLGKVVFGAAFLAGLLSFAAGWVHALRRTVTRPGENRSLAIPACAAFRGKCNSE